MSSVSEKNDKIYNSYYGKWTILIYIWMIIFIFLIIKFVIHQSKNGSSPTLRAGLNVSDSGYEEKFEVSLGALTIILI